MLHRLTLNSHGNRSFSLRSAFAALTLDSSPGLDRSCALAFGSGFACLQFSTQGLRTWVAARVRSKDLTYQVFRPTGWFVAAMAGSYFWRARYSRSLFLRGGMRDNFELQVTGAPLESHELRAGLRQRGCELLLHSLTQGLRTWANKNSALRAGSSKQWLNHIPEKQQSGNRSGNSPGKRF